MAIWCLLLAAPARSAQSPPPPGPIVLVALGDSYTIGDGASAICALGRVIKPCEKGVGYVDDLARLLASDPSDEYMNLGLDGAHVATMLVHAAPNVPAGARVVTIFEGMNDMLWAASPDDLADWFEQLQWTIATIKDKAPNAMIVIANVPNPMYNPSYRPGGPQEYTFARRTLFAGINNRQNELIASLGYKVVDLRCDKDLYDAKNYAPPDLLHWNDAGHMVVAKKFADVIQGRDSGVPLTACPPYTEIPKE